MALRRFIVLTLLVIASGPMPLPAEIRVASFNLRNYLSMDRWADGRWRRDHPKPEREKADIRRAILAVKPDILVLQEMGPAPYLRELQRDLAAEGLEYPVAVLMEGADPDRHVALLSRLEPAGVVRHDDLRFAYLDDEIPVKRGLLEAVFATDRGPLHLYALHLKSHYTDDKRDPSSAERREKEARAIRDRLLDRHPGAEGLFLVAGDFNDHPASAPLKRFRQRGDLAIAEPVDLFDGTGEVWTYFHDGRDRYSRVDYFLVSAELAPLVTGGVGRIHERWTGGSDHRLIDIALELNPVPVDTSR